MPITPFIALFVPLLSTLFVVGWLLIRSPRYSLALLLVSLVTGQLVRFALPGQGGGLLLSDIAVVFLILSVIPAKAGIQTLNPGSRFKPGMTMQKRCHSDESAKKNLLCILLPFLVWSLSILILNVPSLGMTASLIALAYWLRLTTLFLLIPTLFILFRDPSMRLFIHRGLLIVITILCFLGFFQLIFYSNLQFLVHAGWDPHDSRLVSTWLDPNFFGAFLVVTLPWVVAHLFQYRRYWLGLVVGAEVLALFFTQSRSSLLALALICLLVVPIGIMWWLRRPHPSRFFAVTGTIGIVFILGLGLFVGLGSRGASLLYSDATANIRIEGLKAAWPLAVEHMWLGVGYNAYQFAARDAGIIGDFTIHSRSGADNNLLTIWITTGIVGVVLFLVPWAAAFIALIQKAVAQHSNTAAAVAVSILILLIHSQFLNSALYSHLLITIILLVTLELSESVSSRL